MSLKVSILGSGSRGNAALVVTARSKVLIDAGFSYRSLCRRLAEVGESPESLDAVLVSHEHSDHISGLPVLSRKVKAPIYMTGRTSAAIDWGEKKPHVETFEAGAKLAFGDLEIETFTIPHDAVDPVGFTFRQNGFKVGLATDLGYVTESIKRHLQGCDMLVLESNHDLEMLKVGPYPWFVKQRVMSRVGHLSNQAVSDFLTTEFDRSTRILVLAHLSGNNNHPEIARMFADQALRQAGASATRLIVADQDRPSEVYEF
ncbi:MAG: MBL fold metallo-hydrolase [Bryobacterales bacterium]